jgi:type IV pilus assembly protein PilO
MAIGANLTKREQTLISIAILAFVAVGAFWFYIYTPKNDELLQLESHIEALEAQNRQARVDLTRGTTEELLAEAAMYEENLQMIRNLVPTSNEVPALLENVSTAARRVGLDLAAVEPVPVILGEEFDTYRYKIALIGGYHAIARFLSNVGSLDRIVAPVGLELTLHQDNEKLSGKAREARLSAKLQIQTYVVNTTPEDSTHFVQ